MGEILIRLLIATFGDVKEDSISEAVEAWMVTLLDMGV